MPIFHLLINHVLKELRGSLSTLVFLTKYKFSAISLFIARNLLPLYPQMGITYQHILEKVQSRFAKTDIIANSDIEELCLASKLDISKKTVNWMAFHWAQKGLIQRVGHGQYQLGSASSFEPSSSRRMRKIEKVLHEKHPFIKHCQWDLSQVNAFSQHLINFNILFVDVEKDAVESVYHLLKELFGKVMKVENLYDDLSEFNDYIFIRRLITEAPIKEISQVQTAPLEKILVDLATDKEFEMFQGNEILTIFNTALEQYTINQSLLLRYASRRGKKKELECLMNKMPSSQKF